MKKREASPHAEGERRRAAPLGIRRRRNIRGRLVLLGALLAGCAGNPSGRPVLPPVGAVAPAPELSSGGRVGMAQHGRPQRFDEERCVHDLWYAGVRFERLHPSQANGVAAPLRLTGPIGGIWVQPRNGSQVHAILDCRLATALLHWAPSLQRAGVVVLEHYSMYRPGARVRGRGRVSGHARGFAIDAARFRLHNGQTLDVLTDWEDRTRGEPPCVARDEAQSSQLLRWVVCDAVARGLFQVVLTPHHDRAHRNHVHLELKPEVSWTYVR